MFIARYKQIVPSGRRLSHLVAITIALSFFATLVPIANASFNKSSAMPCCAGKSAHCDSGIAPKKPLQPKPEPMCGLKTASLEEDDGITIVAESSHAESHYSHSQTAETGSSRNAAESASLSGPCRMDCGACATASSRQQKRERGVFQPLAYQISTLTALPGFENLSVLFSSNEDWHQTSPRGPPSNLR
jgi:hypothetical protein